MSGHSKWHNIRIKKQKMDKVRGKLFSKLAREIMVAAKDGGGNPDVNPRLRSAIDRAKEGGLPNDSIQRAIQRGTGDVEGASYESITYEAYAPGGVAVLVEVLTDNRNRTAGEIRNLLSKHGGALGESGSVAWMFDRQGLITVEKDKVSEDALFEIALDSGADDVRSVDDAFEVVTSAEQFFKVKRALDAAGIPMTTAEITMVPKTTVRLEGKPAQQVLRLIEALEDHDDVQQAYANFDVPDEVLQEVG
ncbi:MAG: YebC/PmpR family DNA-binding transcriptional regulator [bacterium]